MENPNDSVAEEVVCALGKIDATQPYGPELFNAIARVSINLCIEAVLLRIRPTDGQIEVFLSLRSEEETAYPGLWHCPGTVKRPGESEYYMFRRLQKSDLPINGSYNYDFIGFYDNPLEARGHFFHLIYLVSAKNKIPGNWFLVDALPENIVEHHREVIIPKALKAFLKNR